MSRLVSLGMAGALLLVGACTDRPSSEVGDRIAGPLASETPLPHTMNTNFSMPVAVSATITPENCTNNPGPWITFEGAAALGGFGIDFIFRNNVKGTHEHEEDVTVDVEVLPAGESIVIPKQPVDGGTGGNPFIWVQFVDGNGSPMTEEIFVGRCVQGPWNVGATVAVSTAVTAEVTFESCSNNPGPVISYSSDVALSGGVDARVIFRNNDNPVGGPHEASEEMVSTVNVIADGTSFSFPKQPVHGGVGGNPWIYGAFEHADGSPIGDEELIGRCVQLSQST